jgi:hypothetical protein
MQIDADQFKDVAQRDPDRFAVGLLDHIIQTMPDEVRGLPAHLALRLVLNGIERARSHGLSSDEDLAGFVCVMFDVAPNFDQEPTLKRILADSALGDVHQRWQALFARTPELQTAWERAGWSGFYDHQAWTVKA